MTIRSQIEDRKASRLKDDHNQPRDRKSDGHQVQGSCCSHLLCFTSSLWSQGRKTSQKSHHHSRLHPCTLQPITTGLSLLVAAAGPTPSQKQGACSHQAELLCICTPAKQGFTRAKHGFPQDGFPHFFFPQQSWISPSLLPDPNYFCTTVSSSTTGQFLENRKVS